MPFIAEQIHITIKINPSAVDQSIVLLPRPGCSVVRAKSQYTKFADAMPGQGTYKNQPINVPISRTINLSLSPPSLLPFL